jgi:aspartate/methionine/tyrosine aminotransferase
LPPNTRRGWPVSAAQVLITAGTSEGIEIALSAIADPGDEVLVPMPTYPLYTAVLAKIGAKARYYRTDPSTGWMPDVDQIDSLVTPRTRALVIIDPNNPTGATYPVPVRRALLDLAERRGLVVLADEVYGDLGYEGQIAPLGSLDTEALVVSFSSLSKAYLAPGWRTGWMAFSNSPRFEEMIAAVRKLSDGRLCSTVPMQYAVKAALEGDRSHQVRFRAALQERAALTAERLRTIPGFTCVTPRAGFYAMPSLALPPGRTDEDFVLSLLRATGVLVVYGSGFGLPPTAGFMRIVFLADPAELTEVYRLMDSFTAEYLRAA